MPRTGGANRRNPDSETPDDVEFAEWMEAEAAKQVLRGICGCWCDKGGAKFQLKFDDATMKVWTTMVRGKTPSSKGFIHIEWRGNHGRIVWSRDGAGVFAMSKLDHTSLIWQSSNSRPLRWDRLEKWNENDQLATEASQHIDGKGHWDKWEDWQQTGANAVQRRAQLRRELQENRQHVIEQEKQEKAKKQGGNDRYRSQKGAPGIKNDAPEKQRDGLDLNFSGKHAHTGAKAKRDVWKSELKMNEHVVADTAPTFEHRRDAQGQSSSRNTRDMGRTMTGADSKFRENNSLKHEVRIGGTVGNCGGLPLSAPPPPPPANIVGMTRLSSGSMSVHGCGHSHAAQKMTQGFGVGEGPGLLSQLCIGPTMVMDPNRCTAAPDMSQQHNLCEHSVHGPIVQPWVVPPSWAVTVGPDGNPPDLQCVLSALEWYFSDANLSCDLYLRSLMTPVEGWVPLMVLMTLSRMQAMGTDCIVLRQAASCSPMLELDSTGFYTRIRDIARRTCWLPTRHHG